MSKLVFSDGTLTGTSIIENYRLIRIYENTCCQSAIKSLLAWLRIPTHLDPEISWEYDLWRLMHQWKNNG